MSEIKTLACNFIFLLSESNSGQYENNFYSGSLRERGGSQMEQLLPSLLCNMRISEDDVNYKSLNGFFMTLNFECWLAHVI